VDSLVYLAQMVGHFLWARSWGGVVVKYCANGRKVLESIPGDVTGDSFRGIRQFNVSIQHLKMSTNILLGVKTVGAYG
jgi:hypothetical protein